MIPGRYTFQGRISDIAVIIRKLKKLQKVLAFLEKIVYDKQVARVRRRIWRVGQEVKTPPSHGGIRGSIPLQAVFYIFSIDIPKTLGVN